jgi:hypothetical protein
MLVMICRYNNILRRGWGICNGVKPYRAAGVFRGKKSLLKIPALGRASKPTCRSERTERREWFMGGGITIRGTI